MADSDIIPITNQIVPTILSYDNRSDSYAIENNARAGGNRSVYQARSARTSPRTSPKVPFQVIAENHFQDFKISMDLNGYETQKRWIHPIKYIC